MSPGVSGKYRLERRLGGGGMAEVFAGSTVGAEGFSRQVAIKRVLAGLSDDAAFARMFVAEARISSRLAHPNIVSVLDFDRDGDGRLFLVMELVDGKDLDAVLALGPLPYPVVIFVIGEILRGLGFAHDLPPGSDVRSVVHRDVSPHNVLLSWEGAVKLSDFGIAKARAASAATASELIKGKPAYMSPEQANGEPLDGRSDLFAVGVMLWEMLVGQRLFVGDDTRALLAQVLFRPIPRPRALRPDVPRDLDGVTMKLLERDLPARYATAEDAIADLVHCADAPRAGREALMAVLAERFPDAVPIRRSAERIRSLGATPTPLPGAIPPLPGPIPPGTPTLPGPPAGPIALPLPSGPIAPPVPGRPGLGTLRSAPTATLGRPGRGRSPDPVPAAAAGARERRGLPRIVAPLALLAASGVVAFAIVSAVRRPPASAPRTDSRLGSAAAASPALATSVSAPADSSSHPRHVATALPPPDQLPVDTPADAAIATLPPMDAGTSAPQSAIAVQSPHRTAEKRTGTLRVVAMPILTVKVDGKSHGDSPLTVTLKVGKHRVQLQNVENNIHEVVSVTITEHQTTTIDRMPR